MGDALTLKLYNTLTRAKVDFKPIDDKNVRMYVCGPTVYDFAHIGNARPVIVFDVLYRLLRHVYGENHVTYARNITDVDDKINARALRDFPGLPLNEAIRRVTEKTEKQFLDDAKSLGCLPPTHQPRATEHIVQMITMIQSLLDRGNAYVTTGAEGREVLFSVPSMPDYGQLSKRKLEDQQAGARIAVEAHKRHPGDFVLWKESAENEPGWHAEFGFEGQKQAIFGRPGWHIECSAMSQRYLGETFDIHGGGLDLIFPHHENEIAQSRCANETSVMATVWMHNGFLQVEGKKMSKSEGNFVTIRDNLRGNFPNWYDGSIHGLVLRYVMLNTHYQVPIDWTKQKIIEAQSKLKEWYSSIDSWFELNGLQSEKEKTTFFKNSKPLESVINALANDLDTHTALMKIGEGFNQGVDIGVLASSLSVLGLLSETWSFLVPSFNFKMISSGDFYRTTVLARQLSNSYANSDSDVIENINKEIMKNGYVVELVKNNKFEIGLIDGRLPIDLEFFLNIDDCIKRRLELLKAKNFAEADKIRD
ncbi:MAG: cysteinyl-tRNA synthetase, partial [Pseudomonadota bacterium]